MVYIYYIYILIWYVYNTASSKLREMLSSCIYTVI